MVNWNTFYVMLHFSRIKQLKTNFWGTEIIFRCLHYLVLGGDYVYRILLKNESLLCSNIVKIYFYMLIYVYDAFNGFNFCPASISSIGFFNFSQSIS